MHARPIPPTVSWTSAARLALAAVALASSAALAHAQTTAVPAAQQPAGPYKNVQVLNDMTPAQLHDTMVFFAAVTGGNCQGCHVRGADGEMAFEKDDSDHKTTARTMITMVRAINTQHFKGEDRVTCATCHQARRTPNPLPPLSQELTPDQLAAQQGRGGQSSPAAGGPPAGGPPPAGGRAEGARGQAGAGAGGGRGPQRPTETVDQVLDKYVQAIGGREAVTKLKTRTRKGTVTNRADLTVNVLVEDSATGQIRTSVDGPPAPTARAFDGKGAWIEGGNRVRDLEGVEAVNVGLAADLALPLTLKDTYNALGVQNYGRIAGHQVITLQGRRANGVTEQLLFDRESGFLVRRSIRLRTPMGELPVQIDYDDYRPVEGVQTPFRIRITDWESVSTFTFSDVTFNQPIDAARFARPASPGLR